MKRGTIDHPKVKRLVRALGCPKLMAIGILESLWHWTARYAIQGDIGKHTNQDIADGIDWDGDADNLVDALVSAGWLDLCADHRLVVHDWEDHADESTRKTLKNRGLGFVSGKFPEKSGKGRPKPEPEPFHSEEKYQASARDPEPATEPTPSPEPQAAAEPPPEDPTDVASREMAESGFTAFWLAYPRKYAMDRAWAQWLKIDPDVETRRRIIAAVQQQAFSPEWRRENGKYIPAPDKYLRERRWIVITADPSTYPEQPRARPRAPKLDASEIARRSDEIWLAGLPTWRREEVLAKRAEIERRALQRIADGVPVGMRTAS